MPRPVARLGCLTQDRCPPSQVPTHRSDEYSSAFLTSQAIKVVFPGRQQHEVAPVVVTQEVIHLGQQPFPASKVLQIESIKDTSRHKVKVGITQITRENVNISPSDDTSTYATGYIADVTPLCFLFLFGGIGFICHGSSRRCEMIDTRSSGSNSGLGIFFSIADKGTFYKVVFICLSQPDASVVSRYSTIKRSEMS